MRTSTHTHHDIAMSVIGILKNQSKYVFTLQEFQQVALPIIALLYPNNFTAADTTRYSLQQLRKFDIVKFVDNEGIYKIL